MNVYHLMLTPGLTHIAANGRRLVPAPAKGGNPWQRFALTLMSEEFGEGRHPVNYLLLGRHLAAGRPVPPNALPPVFRGHDCRSAMELTSTDIDRAVAGILARLSGADETDLVDAITRLDYPLVEGLLAAGVVQSRKTTTALLTNYTQSGAAGTSGSRRDTLQIMLRCGLDTCTSVDGRSLLHHICSGPAPAQDIGVILDDAGTCEIINQRDAGGDTPLLSYCRRQGAQFPNRAGLTCLLDAGADPNISNGGETAYMLLRAGGNSTLAERLLDYGYG